MMIYDDSNLNHNNLNLCRPVVLSVYGNFIYSSFSKECHKLMDSLNINTENIPIKVSLMLWRYESLYTVYVCECFNKEKVLTVINTEEILDRNSV